jgi:hydrogenase maturation factor
LDPFSTCSVCSDEATPARIVECLPGGIARAEAGGTILEIDIQLCDAAAGDYVLVHAGVAIAIIRATDHRGSAPPEQGGLDDAK